MSKPSSTTNKSKTIVLLLNAKDAETADRFGRDIANSFPHGLYRRQFLTVHFPAKAIMRDLMKKNPKVNVFVFGNTNANMQALEQYQAAAARFDKKIFVGALNLADLERSAKDNEEFLAKARTVIDYEKGFINMHLNDIAIDH